MPICRNIHYTLKIISSQIREANNKPLCNQERETGSRDVYTQMSTSNGQWPHYHRKTNAHHLISNNISYSCTCKNDKTQILVTQGPLTFQRVIVKKSENMSPFSCNGWIISFSLKEVAWIRSFSDCHHPFLYPHATRHQVNEVTMAVPSVRCNATDYLANTIHKWQWSFSGTPKNPFALGVVDSGVFCHEYS